LSSGSWQRKVNPALTMVRENLDRAGLGFSKVLK
jgi:hypothetical protein